MKRLGKETVIAVIGAGGKMGMRICANLAKTDAELLLCENSPAGIGRINAAGLETTPTESAARRADVVVLAVPDRLIGAISRDIVPIMAKESVLLTLDPAAAFAGEVFIRPDLTYVVAHPCHPPLFGDQDTEEARKDLFGGVAAKQDIVIALDRGSEELFDLAQEVGAAMFAPVVKCHRITVEQMAILEPAAAEVCVAAAAVFIKQVIDEAVERGVPRDAATSFLLGHTQIPLAIVLKNVNPFSDAAYVAIDYGRERIFKSDWKKVFEPDAIREVLKKMLHPTH